MLRDKAIIVDVAWKICISKRHLDGGINILKQKSHRCHLLLRLE